MAPMKPSFSCGVSGLIDEMEAQWTPPASPQQKPRQDVAARRIPEENAGHTRRVQRPHAPQAMQRPLSRVDDMDLGVSPTSRQIGENIREVEAAIAYLGEIERENLRRIEILMALPASQFPLRQSDQQAVGRSGAEDRSLVDESQDFEEGCSELLVEGYAMCGMPYAAREDMCGHEARSHLDPRFEHDEFGSTCDDSLSGLLDTSAYA